MERKFLKDLGLEEEAINKIMAENGKDVQAEQGKTAAKEVELTAAQNSIQTLQNAAKQFDGVDVAGLQKQIADANAKYNHDLKAAKVDAAVSLALVKAGALNVTATRALLMLDPEQVELEADGTIKGLAEKIDALKTAEDSKMLFPQDTGTKKPVIKGFQPGEGRDSDPLGGDDEPQTLSDAVRLNMASHLNNPNDQHPDDT